jgi:hypothetical protein
MITNKTSQKLFVMLMLSVAFVSYSYAGSLVTFLPCGDLSGNVLRDHSGNGNSAYVKGSPNVIKGKIGKALEFNGNDNFAIMPYKDSYDFGKDESYSISLWVNYASRGVQQVIIEKPGEASPFRIEILPDNKICFTIRDGTNSPKVILGDASGKWHHCCFVKDVKEDKLYTYLDGKLSAEAEDTTTAEIDNKSDIYLCAGDFGNAELYKGFLDDIAIYSKALTKDEVKQAAKGNPPEIYHESELRRFEIVSTISMPFTAIYSYLVVRGIEMAIQGKVAPKISQSDWLLAGGLTVTLAGLVGLWDWANTYGDDISELSNPDEKDRYSDRYSNRYSMHSNQSDTRYVSNSIELAFLSMRF